MPQTGQVASDSTVGAFTALDEGKQREVLGKLSPDAKQGLLAGIKSQQSLSQRTQSAATAGGASTGPAPFAPMKTINTNPLGEAMESSKTLAPVNKALAPVGKFLNSQRGREFQMATGVAGGGIEAPPEIPVTVTAMTPESPRKQGIMDRLMHPSNIRKVARDVGEKYVGKTLGDVILPPPPEPPGPTLSEQATQIVEKQLAVKAARVQAGLDPPAEDTMAEVLRKEFLEPPKKSSVPQNIPLPKATTPTYVPEGTPGAPKPAAPPAPEFSKLSEGPTAASHQVARQNALEEMRNATINKPGWVSKLPDRVTFKKLSPIQQRTLIQQAVASDPQAAGALRTGSRIGSAGDLASWTPEQLWSRYMKEYSSTTPDEGLKQTLKNEIARRGQVTAAPNQFRP